MIDKKQLDRIEKKLDKLEKKLDNHIEEIWTVYKPIKELLKKLERFRLW
jgi:tetrahydromethanopterin S-methyltransferase subunit G|tara:strand:+ start:420 stop:566 length:147 start_codon:yes stop_codon:yes gene_type:complete